MAADAISRETALRLHRLAAQAAELETAAAALYEGLGSVVQTLYIDPNTVHLRGTKAEDDFNNAFVDEAEAVSA